MNPCDPRLSFATWLTLCVAIAACGAEGDGGRPSSGASAGAGAGAPAGSAAVVGGAGAGAGGAGMTASGSAGVSGASGAAGMAGTASMAGAGGAAGAAQPPPASCGEAARPYQVSVSSLDASLVPYTGGDRFWAGNLARAPVAVDPASNKVYVGFTRVEGGTNSAVIAAEGSAPDAVLSVPGAVLGGMAVTNDGVAALLFDPNSEVDARVWAAVARLASDGSVTFNTDLFRSPNLEDVDTKGAPSAGRLGYLAESDQLVAYFGHTQRYDDGVRHQGGYLATLSATGQQTVISGWWGSHNLDQRLLIDGAHAAMLGLGDAYPEGIFFAFHDAGPRGPRTNVIYQLAAAGNGATNGQLGGMVDMGDHIIVPFITNRSIAQDLDAGTWPDIDEAISMMIRDAAANGTDMGLLSVPKAALPMGNLEPIWLMPQVAMGARLGSLKSARYGDGGLILLAWAESTGTQRNQVSSYYTMVVDRTGAVCQPKTPLDAMHAFGPGDDIVARPDGAIVWGNTLNNRVQIVTLTP